MAHDLRMEDPRKVVANLQEAVEKMKTVRDTIRTVSDIGNMDLAIGGLNKTFLNLSELDEPIHKSIQVFEAVCSTIEERAREFEAENENITY